MKWLPNAISLLRAAALVPVLALLGVDPGAALFVFAAAALTDIADGVIARRTGAATRSGAFLDPLADKILILGTLLALVGQGAVEAWPVIVIVGRETFALALRAAGVARGISIEASTYGKAKTTAQAIAVVGLILSLVVASEVVATLATVALTAAVALTVLSGAHLALQLPVLLVPTRDRVADAR